MYYLFFNTNIWKSYIYHRKIKQLVGMAFGGLNSLDEISKQNSNSLQKSPFDEDDAVPMDYDPST